MSFTTCKHVILLILFAITQCTKYYTLPEKESGKKDGEGGLKETFSKDIQVQKAT